MSTLRRGAGLKRTPLARRSPLRARSRSPRVKAMTVRRRVDTGPSAHTKELLWYRAGGCCEVCGMSIAAAITRGIGFARHHRRPRGAGGSRATWINDLSNLLLVCGADNARGCHGRIELHRTESYANGWLVRAGQRPVEVPVYVARFPVAATVRDMQLVLLTDEGTYVEAPR